MTLKFRLPLRRRFWNNKRGNIAIITAMMMIPLTFALGMAYDYTMAEARQDQINGMADVATLAGVTPTLMGGSWSSAQAYSANLFQSQIATVNGVVSVAPVWSGSDNSSGASIDRTLTINYTAGSQNIFASLLGMPTFPLKGASTATSSTAPNIDFYLMLDTSPSMEIAATTTGMATLSGDSNFVDASDRNCTFGCHQSDPSPLTSCTNAPSHPDASNHGSPTTNCQFATSTGLAVPCTVAGTYGDGTAFTTASTFPLTGRDFYDLSRCTGTTLRIDLLNTAAQNLMDVASTTSVNDHASYRMAIYLTNKNQANPANDLSIYTLEPLTSDLTSDVGGAKSAAASITALEVCTNNHLVCATNDNDQDTYLDTNLSTLSASTTLLPNPGNGTNNAGDTPQEVLFIVTDGLNDIGPPRAYPPIDWNGTYCSAIKARGIRIAVLYTAYISGSGGSWYTSSVQPQLPAGLPPGLPTSTPNTGDPMALATQQCASPGLYYEVSTDGDVSAALTHLFQEAVASARLLH